MDDYNPTHRKVMCQANGHPGAGERTPICPECSGIMRRCCQSVLSLEHIAGCQAKKVER